MRKILSISLLAIISIGITGCGELDSQTEQKQNKINEPIRVLDQEKLPGKSPINAAQNVRNLTNNSTKGLDDLLKDSQ